MLFSAAAVSENVANVYPHLYNIHSSLLAPGKCNKLEYFKPTPVSEQE